MTLPLLTTIAKGQREDQSGPNESFFKVHGTEEGSYYYYWKCPKLLRMPCQICVLRRRNVLKYDPVIFSTL